MLTFRLAKPGFGTIYLIEPYWTKNNQDLKQLALETEESFI